MRLALIGDVHFCRLAVAPWRLFNKRILAMLNLWVNPWRKMDASLAAAVVDRARDIDPQMVLCSGDLSTTALEGEFEDAAGALRPIMDGRAAVVVPGNHDRYTRGAARGRVLERYFPDVVPGHFPMLRRLTDRWQLLAIDSAAPRAITSRGHVGAAQIAEASEQLATLEAGKNLVVLCHYPIARPPGVHESWGHRLDDEMELRRLISEFRGRVLYLHGHIHRPWCWRPDDADLRHVIMVNAGSPCQRSRRFPLGQGFWEIHLDVGGTDGVGLLHHRPEQAAGGGAAWTVKREL
jgi:3',5'-cyclic AMP phosphodiesterase CpdA